jgi:hypothetical protein
LCCFVLDYQWSTYLHALDIIFHLKKGPLGSVVIQIFTVTGSSQKFLDGGGHVLQQVCGGTKNKLMEKYCGCECTIAYRTKPLTMIATSMLLLWQKSEQV